MSEKIGILGSTGSIGTSTLDVIRRNPEKYQVSLLTAHQNIEKLFQQCIEFNPVLAVIGEESLAGELAERLKAAGCETRVSHGLDAIVSAARDSSLNTVVAAIVGAAGLLPTLAAVEAGHKVLLANKEALVMSGKIFIDAVKKSGAILLPVDSEHNAIFQSLPEADSQGRVNMSGVNKILLTGSGGPFRTVALESLESVTPEQACAHPNWDMGKKISVDSATMMNKGLELIEACFLFDVGLDKIEVVVHPQSIIHSMVAYSDGSVIAQMGRPDMRTPIAHTLAWPERIESGVEPLDFYQMSNLTFEKPDFNRFPCLKLAHTAMQIGGTAPCVLNAANEVAVDAFLNEQLKFVQIPQVIEFVLQKSNIVEADTLDCVLQADGQAREMASRVIADLRGQQ